MIIICLLYSSACTHNQFFYSHKDTRANYCCSRITIHLKNVVSMQLHDYMITLYTPTTLCDYICNYDDVQEYRVYLGPQGFILRISPRNDDLHVNHKTYTLTAFTQTNIPQAHECLINASRIFCFGQKSIRRDMEEELTRILMARNYLQGQKHIDVHV